MEQQLVINLGGIIIGVFGLSLTLFTSLSLSWELSSFCLNNENESLSTFSFDSFFKFKSCEICEIEMSPLAPPVQMLFSCFTSILIFSLFLENVCEGNEKNFH